MHLTEFLILYRSCYKVCGSKINPLTLRRKENFNLPSRNNWHLRPSGIWSNVLG